VDPRRLLDQAYAYGCLSEAWNADGEEEQRDLAIAAVFFLGHCCKVSDEAAFCLIQRPYISKTLLTRRISPRGSP
ncbi:hypothetical protein Q2451_22760, partial [Escherichia coli]|nr:hypothetical protein [Escherichia coli]